MKIGVDNGCTLWYYHTRKEGSPSKQRREETQTGKYDKQSAWKKENQKRIVLNLNQNTDADILLHLSQQENKQGYLKELIRKDMKASHPSES